MSLQRLAAVAAVICFVVCMGSARVAFADASDAPVAPGQEQYLKAQAAWEKGDWEGSLALCDEALKLNRRYKDAWLLKGQIFWQMKNHKMAVACFDESLKVDPKNVAVWVNRAANLFELERYKDMQESFDRALSIDPKFVPLYKNMGIDYLLMGNFEESCKAFKKLQELGETSVYLAQTRRLLQITDPDQAPPKSWNANLDSYQTVLDLTDPSRADGLVNLTSIEGTAIKFAGSADAPFKYAPNFEVWEGAMIFDKKGDGLLVNGTHYRYRKIMGETMTVEEGVIASWRMSLSSKKCFLLSQ